MTGSTYSYKLFDQELGTGYFISVASCTEKSVLIRIFDMIRIFIRKSANGMEILR